MRILVNAISARIGGIVTYTRNLALSLAEREVDATIAVSSRFPHECKGLWRHWASDLGPIARFLWEQTMWRRTVERIRPDVLFSSANFGLLRSPVPQVLLVCEGDLFDPFYLANCTPNQGVVAALQRAVRRQLILASARHSDRVVTPTAVMRDLLLHWAPDLAGKILVNSYGTKSDSFAPSPKAQRPWRADGCLRLIYVSVYYPHKQPEIICRAVDQMTAAGDTVHATITMNMDETRNFKGGLFDRLMMAEALAKGHITLGRQPYDGLPDLYRGNDVFVFPSISETFGHPMVEAMGCGLPVVAADTPVNREVCGDAALYFQPGSVASLVACLTLLDRDPELRAGLAARGRARVLEFFTWDSHVDRMLDILGEVAGRSRPLES
ncbi:glycosyltransferase family 1 protein [Magnetospirillum sp. 15-1]|uniref:glycosyltransferase family 4 protein n=1 Tax=Magnetospirillum sp. 15-1 TaxID=1979370 RepID=UPI00148343D8|nr:glycosyltransferase family 1 protein [Magnetospirillum sp. 15-1]